jgi:metal-responsive CopG/Arc/MetJ family transcriptional regulator
MPVARRQTLVQLDDHRIAMLDERAASEGKSRSQLIREAVDLLLASGDRAAIDRNIVEAYTRIPADPPDYWAYENAISSIKDEPW